MIRGTIPIISFDSGDFGKSKHPFIYYYKYQKIALQNSLFKNIANVMKQISSDEDGIKQRLSYIKEFYEFFSNEFHFCDEFVFKEYPESSLGTWVLHGEYPQYQDLGTENDHYSLHYILKYRKFFWELNKEECQEYLGSSAQNTDLIGFDLQRQIDMVKYMYRSFHNDSFYSHDEYEAGGVPVKFYKNGKIILKR